MENQNSIKYIILGSILALVTSLLVEIYKNWSQNKDKEKNFKIILKLEIKSVLETINTLIEDYGQKQFFYLAIINELGNRIKRLDKIRDNIADLKDDIKKEEILTLFNSINIYHSDANSLEQIAFNPSQGTSTTPLPWNDDSYKSKRQILAFKGTDLKRSIQDVINYLER